MDWDDRFEPVGTVILRWTARIWSIASALLLSLFFFGGAETMHMTAGEALGFLLFPVGLVAGFGISWWREITGGVVSVGSLGLFYLWLLARDGSLPLNPYFLLFAAPGFLFMLCEVMRRRYEARHPQS